MSGSLCPITLRREAVENYITANLQGYRLRVSCTDAACYDKNIFVYLAKMPDPVTGDMILHFVSVASLGDIAEYPAYSSGMTLEVGNFYRKDSIDLLFRSQELLEDTWEKIKSDVSVLAHTESYAQDSNLSGVEEVIITDFITPYGGSVDLRSGSVFGNNSDEYDIDFTPAFNVVPIVTVSVNREIMVWVDTATSSGVKFKTSEPLVSSDKLSWIAVG